MATRKRTNRLTREQAEWFVTRWDAVRDIELAELRATPIEVKFQQLAGLMASARALGWVRVDRPEDEEVRERWRQLRRKFGVEG